MDPDSDEVRRQWWQKLRRRAQRVVDSAGPALAAIEDARKRFAAKHEAEDRRTRKIAIVLIWLGFALGVLGVFLIYSNATSPPMRVFNAGMVVIDCLIVAVNLWVLRGVNRRLKRLGNAAMNVPPLPSPYTARVIAGEDRSLFTAEQITAYGQACWDAALAAAAETTNYGDAQVILRLKKSSAKSGAKSPP